MKVAGLASNQVSSRLPIAVSSIFILLPPNHSPLTSQSEIVIVVLEAGTLGFCQAGFDLAGAGDESAGRIVRKDSPDGRALPLRDRRCPARIIDLPTCQPARTVSSCNSRGEQLVLDREADDLTSRLEAGSWSATECLDHLARTTLSFLPAISRAVATAPELTTNRPLRTGTIALLLIRNLEPPYRLRYKVIPQLAPQERDFEAAWSSFQNSQSHLSEAVQSAVGLAIDKTKVPCPACAHVTYNAYGAFRMLAAHQRRHLWQMEQILGALEERRALKTAV